MRRTTDPARRFGPLGIAALAAVAGAWPGPGAWAEVACYDVPCDITCSPAPAAISTLVVPSQFPAGASVPIAFVDPGDGRGRFLIATQEGAVLVWDGATGSILPTMFLDLRASSGGPVHFEGERGLLALAVEPDYEVTGRFYVFYTRRDLGGGTLGDVVIARYERSAGDPDVANPASATPILVIEHSSAPNHNGGQLAFGPDGFLYVSVGDGGGACDNNQGAGGDGQRTDSLLGKILRLDVRNIDPAAGPPDDCGIGIGNYAVPSTNPFSGQEPACDEVWAYGLRNPFRFSFDRDTGDLYVADVGQNKWEEINLKLASTPAPVNWGWVCREGCQSADNDQSMCSVSGCPVDPGGPTPCRFPRATGFYDPVLCHYNPTWGAIMAGYRYRGGFVPSISGDFLYGDFRCGQIWKTDTLVPANPYGITSSCWADGFGGITSFAEDTLGELYVLRASGRIECIHNGQGCYWAGWDLFYDGFESGDTTMWSSTTP